MIAKLTLREAVGEMIRIGRGIHGFTQKQLAQNAHCAEQTLRDLEMAHRQTCGEIFSRVCGALNTTPEAVILAAMRFTGIDIPCLNRERTKDTG
jgi:transcriptional regulator with XRE-family HTH domain